MNHGSGVLSDCLDRGPGIRGHGEPLGWNALLSSMQEGVF